MSGTALHLREMVDEYAELTRQQTAIKGCLEALKARFEKQAMADLKDTKRKSAVYWGSGQNRVVVQMANSVKPISVTMLNVVLGNVAGDFVKQEVKITLTEPCKRLLAMVFQGNYTEGRLEELIQGISSDAKIQATLKKKLKGRWEKDTAALMQVAGLEEQQASDCAYLVAEVIGWEWLCQVLKAGGWSGSVQEAIEIIRSAVIVDESLKVGIELEN